MMENIEDVGKLEEQSNELSNMSTEYSNSTDELRKINIWQNIKYWIPIFFIVFIIFIIILYIIF